MALVTYKIALDALGLNRVVIERGARILSAHIQDETPHLWYQCDPTLPKDDERVFLTAGTGAYMPDVSGFDYKFIGSCHARSGLVWHVFEQVKKAN